MFDKLRQLFCKHEFEFINRINTYEHGGGKIPVKIRDVYICKKCLKKYTIEL